MYDRAYRCRCCGSLFCSEEPAEIEGSDAAESDVEKARLQQHSHEILVIVHECSIGGYGLADYVGVVPA